jgi:hypothetical protein
MGEIVWTVFRRALSKDTELKVYLCNAPFDIPITELVRMAGLRWPVETAIEKGMGALGMGDGSSLPYDSQSWVP